MTRCPSYDPSLADVVGRRRWQAQRTAVTDGIVVIANLNAARKDIADFLGGVAGEQPEPRARGKCVRRTHG
jgi:hypothetical protein